MIIFKLDDGNSQMFPKELQGKSLPNPPMFNLPPLIVFIIGANSERDPDASKRSLKGKTESSSKFSGPPDGRTEEQRLHDPADPACDYSAKK